MDRIIIIFLHLISPKFFFRIATISSHDISGSGSGSLGATLAVLLSDPFLSAISIQLYKNLITLFLGAFLGLISAHPTANPICLSISWYSTLNVSAHAGIFCVISKRDS